MQQGPCIGQWEALKSNLPPNTQMPFHEKCRANRDYKHRRNILNVTHQKSKPVYGIENTRKIHIKLHTGIIFQ